jgi:hypothetical protein
MIGFAGEMISRINDSNLSFSRFTCMCRDNCFGRSYVIPVAMGVGLITRKESLRAEPLTFARGFWVLGFLTVTKCVASPFGRSPTHLPPFQGNYVLAV